MLAQAAYYTISGAINGESALNLRATRRAVDSRYAKIMEVMREAGLTVPSSCEQGACGTCLTTVMEGEVDHQDVYLNDSEKRSNTCMMTCVSRAKSPRLVLDI